jgi:hypothetical protein
LSSERHRWLTDSLRHGLPGHIGNWQRASTVKTAGAAMLPIGRLAI